MICMVYIRKYIYFFIGLNLNRYTQKLHEDIVVTAGLGSRSSTDLIVIYVSVVCSVSV